MSGVLVIVSAGSVFTSPPTQDAIVVLTGGEVLSTTVFGSGNVDLSKPGAIGSDTTVLSGGYEAVAFGAVSHNATIDSGGQQQVSGLAFSALINTSGDQLVLNSGIASGAILRGGVQEVGSGARAFGTTATSSGTELVFSGGSAAGTVVSSGGTLWMLGGSASATVVSGGTEEVGDFQSFVSGSFVVESATIGAGGVLLVASGGTAINTVLSNGAAAFVKSGGTAIEESGGVLASGATISANAVLFVLDGGTAVQAQILGDQSVMSGGKAISSQIGDSGQISVSSGGSAFAVEVNSGGIVFIDSGGSATDTFVASGGSLNISSGGVASNTVIETGGTETVFGGGLEILDAPNFPIGLGLPLAGTVVVGSGGELEISANGIASGADVHFGGEILVLSGGTADGAQVESGGLIVLSARGSANSATLKSGAAETISGGSDVSASVSAAQVGVFSGGIAAETQLLDSGNEFVFAGGTALSTQVSAGGELVLSGGASSAATVYAGGIAFVHSGGPAVSTTVSSGGQLLVSSGAFASNTVLLGGGTEILSFDGLEVLDTINYTLPGGLASVGSVVIGSDAAIRIGSGGGGAGIDVHAAGVLEVFSGGVAIGARVESGGEAHLDRGSAVGTVLLGGTEFDSQGHTSATSVGNLGTEVVMGIGAVADGAVVSSGGLIQASAFGVTSNTRLLSGGSEAVGELGLAVGTVVSGGGEQRLSFEGVGNSTTVLSAGSEIISSGGEAISMTVADRGRAVLLPGGAVTSPTIAVGGVLTAAGTISGPIHDDGTIVAVGGTLNLAAGLAGSGTLEIGAGATVIADAMISIAVLLVDAGGSMKLNGVTIVADPLTIDAGGTITGNGTISGALTDNGTVVVSGGSLELTDAITGPGTLTIADGGTLRLDGAVASGTTIAFASGGTGTLQLADPTAMRGAIVGKTAGDKVVNVACFAAGTRIRTSVGEIAVEAVRSGDLAATARGRRFVPVVWTGRRYTECHRHPRPWDVWPVRIRAHAFGPGRPRRDLWLSPDHAVLLAGALIPVRYLVNGATVVQEHRDAIEYWHVELARHDVLFAEGLACESYLDTGNRGAFANGGAAVELHPDFARRVWKTKACAPLVLDGPLLVRAKRRLLHHALALGHAITGDPGLVVLADGRRCAAEIDGVRWCIRLPEATSVVHLRSRVWCPAHMRPEESDTRRLGVAIRRLWLDGREASLHSPGFGAGWHAPELHWRWTSREAEIFPVGARELAFEVAIAGDYWRDGREADELERTSITLAHSRLR